MKGLALSQAYFEAVGRPALERAFPEVFPRMAIGLAGEGSECFGFDDAFSRDHDWGAGFCIWLTRADFERYGAAIQTLYDSLPHDGQFPLRTDTEQGSARVGCLSIDNWYHRYTGSPTGPETLEQWRFVPEAFLATAVNGVVFHDPLGEFSAIREKLLNFYPEDVRRKKLAARCAAMAQAGQYNCPRCLKRGERVAAQLALAEFVRAACSTTYLLNRRYTPFYKWMHRGLEGLPILHGMYGLLDELSGTTDADAVCALIETISGQVIAELRRQGLSDSGSDFLLDHCPAIMAGIQDPGLRRSHIMED